MQGCLLHAVQETDSVNVTLDSMWQGSCTEVSATDFVVIAAEALIEADNLLLSDFYHTDLMGEFLFIECVDYLRELGAWMRSTLSTPA